VRFSSSSGCVGALDPIIPLTSGKEIQLVPYATYYTVVAYIVEMILKMVEVAASSLPATPFLFWNVQKAAFGGLVLRGKRMVDVIYIASLDLLFKLS
jgi:hypothetical protein